MDLVVTATADAIVMVEAGANEVSEDVIVEALKLAHTEIKKIIDVQLELQRLAGKPKWPVHALQRGRGRHGGGPRPVRRRPRRRSRRPKTRRPARTAPPRSRRRPSRHWPAKTRTPSVPCRSVAPSPSSRRTSCATVSPSQKRRPDGRGTDEIRQITCEVGVVPRTHGSALFTRGQTQAMSLLTLGGDRRVPAHRRPGHRRQEALHPPLQLPALLGGRDRLHARPQAPRHRPRRAGRARSAAGAAGRGGVPLHHPHRVGDPREQRLLLHGQRLRQHPVAHGRRRADQEAGGRHRHGPHQGRRRRTWCSPTSPVSRTTSATWTSRSPARADGITALQMDIKIKGVTLRDPHRGARAGAQAGACSSSARWLETIAEPRGELSPVRAAHLHHPDQPRPDRPRHRQGRRDHPRHDRRVQRPDRHPGRRHHLHLCPGPGSGRGRHRTASRP